MIILAVVAVVLLILLLIMPLWLWLLIVFGFPVAVGFLIHKFVPKKTCDINLDKTDSALDYMRKLPIRNRIFAGTHYYHMTNTLLRNTQLRRSIEIMLENSIGDAADIDNLMRSYTALDSANAQAYGNATAFAPLVGKDVKPHAQDSDRKLDKLLNDKKQIRSDITNMIINYNSMIDDLKSWRSMPLRSWFLTRLSFPEIEHFPPHFNLPARH